MNLSHLILQAYFFTEIEEPEVVIITDVSVPIMKIITSYI